MYPIALLPLVIVVVAHHAVAIIIDFVACCELLKNWLRTIVELVYLGCQVLQFEKFLR